MHTEVELRVRDFITVLAARTGHGTLGASFSCWD